MCGRYTLTRQKGLIEDLEATLDPNVEKSVWWKARFNVAPTQEAPVVTLREGIRVLEMMRWGLVPFWAGRPGEKPPLMINARVEGLQQKPMFRDALQRRRCLVPADGFFEWKKLPGTAKKPAKQPMWIHPKSGELFAFAGLWASAHPEGGELRSFSIVTGPPNDLVSSIHDRMPVILDRSTWDAWLDPATPADQARALLRIPSHENWVAEPVGKHVNIADNDDEQCIAPITAPPDEPPKQGSLF